MYPTQWVFGAVCRETGECFFVPLENRSRQTLIPLIRRYIRPGWHYGYNRRVTRAPRSVGVHTQTVESFWAQVKRSNKHRCSTSRCLLDS
uniref:DDE Tnp4 domain-containing protein n=1 Tax=Trichuris muris TaxID=70415 RepID=A0A5S6QNR2_TRIMR